MKNLWKLLKPLGIGLFMLNTLFLSAQVVNSTAEKAYQGFLKAFLVRSNGQTYIVDGIAKRDRAYFWGQAFMITSLIDSYEENRSEARKQLIIDLTDTFLIKETQDWSWNSWSDDIAWACIAMSRAYQITGNETYKTVAVNNWKFCFERGWDNNLGGGVWENMDKHTKASLSNNPMIISGMNLYEATGDLYFLNNCKRIYDWFRGSGIYNPNTGVVNEAKVNDGSIQYSDHPYNTGSFINAAAALYKQTKDAVYLADAQKAADHVVNAFPILTEEGDSSVRGIAKLARENGLWSKYHPWLLKQTENAWKNRRTDYDITNNNWTKITGSGEQFAMECTSALTVQMVTPILQSIPGTLQAENYNFMKGIFTENTTDTGGGLNVGSLDTGDYLEYIVQVPTSGSYLINYRVAGTSAGSVSFSQDGQTLATTSLPSTGGWQVWQNVSTTVNLTQGTQSLRLLATAGGWNLNKLNITKSTDCSPSAITAYQNVNNNGWQQASSSTLLVGQSITFGPQALDGSWSWSGPNGFSANTREIIVANIQANQGGTYKATYTNDCGAKSTQDFIITINNPCNATAIIANININNNGWNQGASGTVSVGQSITMGPQPNEGGAWNWTGPNGFTTNNREVNINNIQTNQAGMYKATFTNACGAKSTQDFIVTVNPPCTATTIIPYINVNNGGWQQVSNGSSAVGGTINFGPQPFEGTWSWSGPNGYTANTREITLTNIQANQFGTYIATYTNTCGAKSTRNFVITNTQSSSKMSLPEEPIASSTAGNSFSIYPNPNEGILNIDLNNIPYNSVQIYNNTGNLIYSKQIKDQSPLTIDIRNIVRTGIYIVSLQSNGKISTKKLLVK